MAFNGVIQYKNCRKGHDLTLDNARASDGRCIICKRGKDKHWLASERGKETYPERYTNQQEWKRNNSERFKMFGRKSLLKKKYGITLDQYQELWDKQAGLCYICGLAERVNDRTGKVREYLSIDHNHVTGGNSLPALPSL